MMKFVVMMAVLETVIGQLTPVDVGYKCEDIPACKKWPGSCCGTYGNCQSGRYIGCSSNVYKCNDVRKSI
jgi:hypothetical protein